MKLRQILKDKKGAALEMAIFFMVIVFTFCTLVTTMTLTSRSRNKIEEAYFNMDLNNDLIVEDFLLFIDDITTPGTLAANDFVAVAENDTIFFKNDKFGDNFDGATIFQSTILNDDGTMPTRYSKYVLADDLSIEATYFTNNHIAINFILKNNTTKVEEIVVSVDVMIDSNKEDPIYKTISKIYTPS